MRSVVFSHLLEPGQQDEDEQEQEEQQEEEQRQRTTNSSSSNNATRRWNGWRCWLLTIVVTTTIGVLAATTTAMVVKFPSHAALSVLTEAAGGGIVRSSSLSLDPYHHHANVNDYGTTVIDFPTLDDTVEMAMLSRLVYTFRDYNNDNASDTADTADAVCRAVNARNFSLFSPTLLLPPDLLLAVTASDVYCHDYYHERNGTGTQLLIVSSRQRDYIAVVFAGTDDARTALTDTDILEREFGSSSWSSCSSSQHIPGTYLPNASSTTSPRYVRVHGGFEQAVFANDLFINRIVATLDRLRSTKKGPLSPYTARARIFTTGHSLGAANAILTAVGLSLHYNTPPTLTTRTTLQQHDDDLDKETKYTNSLRQQRRGESMTLQQKETNGVDAPRRRRPSQGVKITSINFGAPQTGNSYWHDYIKNYTMQDQQQQQQLSIWRVVMGWDLVPRLPKFFHHVGHTLQLHPNYDASSWSPSSFPATDDDTHPPSMEDDDNDDKKDDDDDDKKNKNNNNMLLNATVTAYYHHTGDEALGYAGVPFGWGTYPFIWVPGALESHSSYRYWKFLHAWQQQQQQRDKQKRQHGQLGWVNDFERVSKRTTSE